VLCVGEDAGRLTGRRGWRRRSRIEVVKPKGTCHKRDTQGFPHSISGVAGKCVESWSNEEPEDADHAKKDYDYIDAYMKVSSMNP
jgi:hypothetical protein